jgi:hypothetical protein
MTDRKPNPDQGDDKSSEASATELDEDTLENASGGRLMPPPPVKLGPYDT